MGNKKKAVVVVADDDLDYLMLAQFALESDFDVVVAGDGEQALELCRMLRPGVLLLDILMPKLNGINLVHALQADKETKDIPVILNTASLFNESCRKDMLAEPNVISFLDKACGIRETIEQVRLVADVA